MEEIRHSAGHSATSLILIWFRLCLWVGLFIVLPMIIIVSGNVKIGSREISDPYSAVIEYFSADARQLALADGFTCQDYNYATTLTDFCTQFYRDSVYPGVYLNISEGVAKEVDLWLAANTLTLGELILL